MSKVYYASLFSIAVAIGILVYYLNSPLQTANASISLKPEDKTIILQGRDFYVQNCASLSSSLINS